MVFPGFGPVFLRAETLQKEMDTGSYIANGRSINLWEDRWIWSKETLQSFSDGRDLRVADVLDSTGRTWDQHKLKSTLTAPMAIKAFQTLISWLQQDDTFYWPFSKDGLYSVRTGNRSTCSYNIALSAMTLWAIWKQRNDKTFRNSLPSPTTTLLNAQHHLSEYIRAVQKLPQSSRETESRLPRVGSHLKRPHQGVLKVNTDAAWNPESKVCAISIVARDHDGRVLAGHAKKISTYSPLAAEALAIREAAMMAYNLNWDRVEFESDCLPLIEACRGERGIAEINLILLDIWSLAAGLMFSGFTWVHREGNTVAHRVAMECSRSTLPVNWMHSPPPWLWSLLSTDAHSASRPPHLQQAPLRSV
ncbi:Ribonuclease H-like superfamily [Sesbania bispinosa]|nr:Ribonuclease H-like superfamily [Sesbania bispinosa]